MEKETEKFDEFIKRLKEEISNNVLLEPSFKYDELRMLIDKIAKEMKQ